MKFKANPWNGQIKSTKAGHSCHAEETILRYATLIPDGLALDLGMGSASDLLAQAQNGRQVIGYDVSKQTVDLAKRKFRKARLAGEFHTADLRKLKIPSAKYALVILRMVLNFFFEAERKAILRKAMNAVVPGGLIFISVLSTDDPLYGSGKHSFVDTESNTILVKDIDLAVHFFSIEEFKFAGWNVLYRSQSLEVDLDHGKKHMHGVIKFLLQKRG